MYNKEIKLEIDPTVDAVIDEIPGNSFIALRKLRWNDSSEFKLDIRKWYTKNTGEEIAGKGVSFMTEDGPSNLIEELLKLGYGDTRKTIAGISNREDFAKYAIDALATINPEFEKYKQEDESTEESEEYYDPKDILDL